MPVDIGQWRLAIDPPDKLADRRPTRRGLQNAEPSADVAGNKYAWLLTPLARALNAQGNGGDVAGLGNFDCAEDGIDRPRVPERIDRVWPQVVGGHDAGAATGAVTITGVATGSATAGVVAAGTVTAAAGGQRRTDKGRQDANMVAVAMTIT